MERAFRPPREIEDQYHASRSFAPVVVELPPIAHQYSAGQAATLAWMTGRGPASLTFGETAEMAGPYSVQRLEQWAQELLARRDDAIFPRPYVIGVEYVCRWVQRSTELEPFPGDANRLNSAEA